MSDPFITYILAQRERLAGADRDLEISRFELRAEIDKRDAEIARLRADRRERIATACLTGLLADPNVSAGFDDMADCAVRFADALIARLDKEAAP
jgi:hypothetical protein